ncbi:hypothetical protein EMPG_14311, partial [Blastomyces silverae]
APDVIRPADSVQYCANRASTQYFPPAQPHPSSFIPCGSTTPCTAAAAQDAQAARLAEKWNYIRIVPPPPPNSPPCPALALHNTGLFGSSSPIESSAKEHRLAIIA